MMISVIVPTKDRPEQIQRCLASILAGTYKNFEIMVVDQSADFATKQVVLSLKTSKVRYFNVPWTGKARALNYALQRIVGEIVVLTDDDCIADKNWLREIHNSYLEHPGINAIFGVTHPYEPEKHLGEICPAIFSLNKPSLTTNPDAVHYLSVGNGNDMSFRKSLFMQVGCFREWLGPGSIGQEGEDTDYIFRILSYHYHILTDPRIVVYHDRWMSVSSEGKLQLSYTRGFLSFCGYHYFSQYRPIIVRFIYMRIKGIIFLVGDEPDRIVRQIAEISGYRNKGRLFVKLAREMVRSTIYLILLLANFLFGLCLGGFHRLVSYEHEAR